MNSLPEVIEPCYDGTRGLALLALGSLLLWFRAVLLLQISHYSDAVVFRW